MKGNYIRDNNIEYIACGNVMIDIVRFSGEDKQSLKHIGGPATFAYSGIKLFTDNVMQLSKVGADFNKYFDSWIEKNKVFTGGFNIVNDYCNHSYLTYLEDGTYVYDLTVLRYRSDWSQDLGYMKTTPEDIERYTGQGGIKGIYLAQNVDYVFWSKLEAIKKRDGFKMMWEIEEPSSYKRYMPAVLNSLRTADALSINFKEACNLFDVSDEEACIRELRLLPVEFILFRVGEKGLYSITKNSVHFLPSAPSDRIVDPTGCGNCSTGAALYALCEGKDALMVGIIANVAAAQNIRQFGVIEDFASQRGFAFEQVRNIYKSAVLDCRR